MIVYLLQYLKEMGINVPDVFTYLSTRVILAAITTLILTIFLGPLFIRKLYQLKIGQPIRDNTVCPVLAELHSKKKDTPTMGGILILTSLLFSLLLWMDLSSSFTLILAFTTIFLGVVGGIDDYLKLKNKSSKGISARAKFFLQFIFATIISVYLLSHGFSSYLHVQEKTFKPPVAKEIYKNDRSIVTVLPTEKYMKRLYVPFVKKPFIFAKNSGAIFFFCLFLFVIIGASNAVNLTDGLDGLAAGLLIMASIVFALIAFFSNHFELSRYLNLLYIEGSGEIAVFLFALSGALLGFLWYNGFPAQVFMGDIGSLTLGGIIGVCAILLKKEILLALVGGIFVAEALSVILQVWSFKYRKKRIFLCAPLHHHFEYKGWSEMKIVLRFWIIGLLLAIIGISSLKFQ